MKQQKPMKVMAQKCPTCPWREGSPYAYLRDSLERDAQTRASRVCHSTGRNAINANTGKVECICRGARDVQLNMLAGIGFLDAPTDEAWNAKAIEMGLVPNRCPVREGD